MKFVVRSLIALTLIIALPVVALAGVLGYSWWQAPIDTVGTVDFQRPLQIPPLAASRTVDGVRTFELQMQRGTSDLGAGPSTETWGVNGNHLGPTLRATRGEQVRVDVRNALGETSTLHWHGMHLPPSMDGGPHQTVAPGATWSPTWRVDQPAASLWYHPHLHGATADHVYRGVAGMFLIDEPGGPRLPHDYGVDDIPVIVQDKKFDGDQLDPDAGFLRSTGVHGDRILVNGTPGPYLRVHTERVRLRLLNASNARSYKFGFDTGQPFALIGTDGGLLPKPVELQHIQLSPGERAEIVVTVAAGRNLVLRSERPELGTDAFAGRFAGGADRFDVLQLRPDAQLRVNAAVPQTLSPKPDLGTPTVTRQFTLSGNRVNERKMDMGRVDETVTVDTTEVWEVRNADGQPHNFHVHDVQFQVLDTDDPMLSGSKDTVYIPPGQTRRLLMRFEHYTDAATPYMFHCHLLAHEDDGLMGQFVVVAPGETARPPHAHPHN